MKTSVLVGSFLALMLATGVASAAKKSYVAPDLDGAKERPNPVNSAVSGEARFTYDDVTKKLCGHITLAPMTFIATASHLHVGDANTAGPVGISFNGFTGKLLINQTLTADEAKVLEGDAYVNVHSSTNPGGEVRDQLLDDGDTSAPDEKCEGDPPVVDAGLPVDAGKPVDAAAPVVDAGSPDPGTGGEKGKPVDNGNPGGAAPIDAGKPSTSATPASTDDGGCNTSGSTDLGSGLVLAAALGLALTMAARRRNER